MLECSEGFSALGLGQYTDKNFPYDWTCSILIHVVQRKISLTSSNILVLIALCTAQINDQNLFLITLAVSYYNKDTLSRK